MGKTLLLMITLKTTIFGGKLTKHVKQKPVANITLFDNGVDYFPSDESETYIKEIRPHFWTYYDNEAVDDDEEAEHGE